MIFSDEAGVFKDLRKMGYNHRRVNHSQGVYVDGDVHTNTIEGFWSLTKNGIRGVYHNVSAKYLQMYLDEYSFRFNRRKSLGKRNMFDAFVRRIKKRARSPNLLTQADYDTIVHAMVFVVLTAPPHDGKLGPAIQVNFPGKNLALAPGQWLVAGSGTAKDISDKLGITSDLPNAVPIVPTAQVFSVSGYFGRAPNNLPGSGSPLTGSRDHRPIKTCRQKAERQRSFRSHRHGVPSTGDYSGLILTTVIQLNHICRSAQNSVNTLRSEVDAQGTKL